MNKRFLAIAIAAGLASPLAANADAEVYGRAHVSLDNIEVGGGASAGGKDAEFDLSDRKSAFGVKGKEDLGGGMSAIYKYEWSVNPVDTGSAIGVRDRWVGLKGGFGSVKFGAMSNNYKSTAAWVDPFWHTAAEGRGAMRTSSDLLNSSGDDSGRMSNLIQFKSANFGGIEAIVDLQANGSGEMTTGLGISYKAKSFKVFVNTLNMENDADADGATDAKGYRAGETAIKFGGTFTMDVLTVGLVMEQTEDVLNSDFAMLSATYGMSDNDTIVFTYGTQSALDANDDTSSFALGYMHKMSKRTMVYAAYLDVSDDKENAGNYGYDAAGDYQIDGSGNSDQSVSGFTLGIKHSF